VSGVHFKNISFKALDASYERVFVVRGAVSCLSVEGCYFGTTSSSSTSSNSYLFDVQPSSDDSIIISGNYFDEGSIGFYFDGTSQSKGLEIRDNVFNAQYYMGVRIQDSDYPKILSNTITSKGGYSNYYGIYLSSCDDSTHVLGNRVSSAGGGKGIYMNNVDASAGKESLIANNFVSLGNKYGLWNRTVL
jgi:parallel beta-helix repeat protein